MKIKIFAVIICICAVIAVDPTNISHAQDSDAVVIVHSSRSNLSELEIKRIFTGDVTQWPDGTQIKVLINSNGSLYGSFCKKYLNMSPSSADQVWVKKQISSGAALPRKLSSAVMKTLVSNSNAFIGFVWKSEVDGSVKAL
jgi:ABC-type phosphate transport system substrate-binding protein